MRNRHRTIVVIIIGTVLIALNVYQYVLAQHNKNSYIHKEKGYTNVINQTTEALLKDEVYITDKELLQRKEWNLMFDRYGLPDSVGNVKLLRIPIDNKEILKLFSDGAKPILMESDDTAVQVRYNKGNKTYDLIFYKSNDTIFKTVTVSFDKPEYLVGYRNMNNLEYSPVFVNLYTQNQDVIKPIKESNSDFAKINASIQNE